MWGCGFAWVQVSWLWLNRGCGKGCVGLDVRSVSNVCVVVSAMEGSDIGWVGRCAGGRAGWVCVWLAGVLWV